MNLDTKTRPAQAAVVRQTGGPFGIESIEVAAPRNGEVLVRMVGVGVCHTDMACRDGFPVPMPIVLGHEGAGVIEAIGEGVKRVRVGDHVVLAFNSCGTCQACNQEHPAACLQFLAFNFGGVRISDGSTPLSQRGTSIHGVFFGQSSFSTHAIAHEINAVVVSPTLPLEILGPLGCGIMTGAGSAINSINIQPGQSLAIFGAGTVGLSALLGARAVGADKVVVIEPSAKRRALALELGASAAFDPRETKDLVAAIRDAKAAAA